VQFGYPRPQLQRDEWQSLNGPWHFAFDDERRYRRPADIATWPLSIQVPFPPESMASGLGDRGFHAACWYQREVEIQPGDQHVLLHFGAVDYRAHVWVNDVLVATHEGGHTPFSSDITFALHAGGTQTITVMADDDPHELQKPRGKQDWQLEPHSIWYPRTTGIWQTVWLERVQATHIEKVRWCPHVYGYALELEARIGGQPADDLTLDVSLVHGERVLVRDSYQVIGGEVDRRLILSDPGIEDSRNELLWSPERPTLLDARLTLRRGGTVIDDVRSYAALRSVSVERDRFVLNGRPYQMRMVLDQGYWPDTLLAAPSDEALRRDVELAKAMGFNGVRKHQKIENPRYLYWADKLGLMVWEEMPSAYRFTRTAIRRMVHEWTEAIERDFSHPCIVMWVPFNESWGVPELPNNRAHRHAVEALYHLTKTLDPSRPVLANDGWESGTTDIIGVHDYDTDAERLRERYGKEATPQMLFDRRRPGGRVLTLEGHPHRGQPIMVTEFGGIALASGHAGDGNAWGYASAASEQAFLQQYGALVKAVADAPLLCGFCYTQFADTFQEANGLLRADRSPKTAIELIYQATRVPAAYRPDVM
jgi:beta-galactosidase/beta-glucuronidase